MSMPSYPSFPPPPPQPNRAGRSGCLGGFFRSARVKAHAIFGAHGPGRVMDPTIDAVQKWRAIAGAVASFLLIWTYGIDGGWSGVFEDGISKVFLAPLILLLVGPLVILGFILYAPRQHRPLLRSRLRHPLKAVGWYVGALATGIGGLYLASQGKGYAEELLGGAAGYLVGALLPLAMLPVLLWMAAFLFFSSGAAARYAFNTADVHASLPAILTVTLVWALNLVSLGDGLPNGPAVVKVAAFLGGPLSVTAVSCWELHYLRSRYGVRIRG